MRIITSFQVLIQKAKALGEAEKSGDAEAIAKAKIDHDIYKELCLKPDEMSIGCTYGDL